MVKALVSEFNKSQIQYAVTGAIAASYCGRPRSTTDVDFIVKVNPRNLFGFIRLLQHAGLDSDEKRIKAQFASGYDVVTVQDRSSPYDADFILRPTGLCRENQGPSEGLEHSTRHRKT